jgi:hypothetical protein
LRALVEESVRPAEPGEARAAALKLLERAAHHSRGVPVDAGEDGGSRPGQAGVPTPRKLRTEAMPTHPPTPGATEPGGAGEAVQGPWDASSAPGSGGGATPFGGRGPDGKQLFFFQKFDAGDDGGGQAEGMAGNRTTPNRVEEEALAGANQALREQLARLIEIAGALPAPWGRPLDAIEASLADLVAGHQAWLDRARRLGLTAQARPVNEASALVDQASGLREGLARQEAVRALTELAQWRVFLQDLLADWEERIANELPRAVTGFVEGPPRPTADDPPEGSEARRQLEAWMDRQDAVRSAMRESTRLLFGLRWVHAGLSALAAQVRATLHQLPGGDSGVDEYNQARAAAAAAEVERAVALDRPADIARALRVARARLADETVPRGWSWRGGNRAASEAVRRALYEERARRIGRLARDLIDWLEMAVDRQLPLDRQRVLLDRSAAVMDWALMLEQQGQFVEPDDVGDDVVAEAMARLGQASTLSHELEQRLGRDDWWRAARSAQRWLEWQRYYHVPVEEHLTAALREFRAAAGDQADDATVAGFEAADRLGAAVESAESLVLRMGDDLSAWERLDLAGADNEVLPAEMRAVRAGLADAHATLRDLVDQGAGALDEAPWWDGGAPIPRDGRLVEVVDAFLGAGLAAGRAPGRERQPASAGELALEERQWRAVVGYVAGGELDDDVLAELPRGAFPPPSAGIRFTRSTLDWLRRPLVPSIVERLRAAAQRAHELVDRLTALGLPAANARRAAASVIEVATNGMITGEEGLGAVEPPPPPSRPAPLPRTPDPGLSALGIEDELALERPAREDGLLGGRRWRNLMPAVEPFVWFRTGGQPEPAPRDDAARDLARARRELAEAVAGLDAERPDVESANAAAQRLEEAIRRAREAWGIGALPRRFHELSAGSPSGLIGAANTELRQGRTRIQDALGEGPHQALADEGVEGPTAGLHSARKRLEQALSRRGAPDGEQALLEAIPGLSRMVGRARNASPDGLLLDASRDAANRPVFERWLHDVKERARRALHGGSLGADQAADLVAELKTARHLLGETRVDYYAFRAEIQSLIHRVGTLFPPAKPMEVHHFAPTDHPRFSDEMRAIAANYGLRLDGDWNRERLPHRGRHSLGYHELVLDGMRRADAETREQGGGWIGFLTLFEHHVKAEIRANPSRMYSEAPLVGTVESEASWAQVSDLFAVEAWLKASRRSLVQTAAPRRQRADGLSESAPGLAKLAGAVGILDEPLPAADAVRASRDALLDELRGLAPLEAQSPDLRDSLLRAIDVLIELPKREAGALARELAAVAARQARMPRAAIEARSNRLKVLALAEQYNDCAANELIQAVGQLAP